MLTGRWKQLSGFYHPRRLNTSSFQGPNACFLAICPKSTLSLGPHWAISLLVSTNASKLRVSLSAVFWFKLQHQKPKDKCRPRRKSPQSEACSPSGRDSSAPTLSLTWSSHGTQFMGFNLHTAKGIPKWLSGEEPACQCRRRKCDPWVRKSSWRKSWLPTLAYLPGESFE